MSDAAHGLSSALLHDLRTPLGQIIGYAELLAERAEDGGDERLVPDLHKISAAGYHMLALFEANFTSTPAPFTWADVDLLRGVDGAEDLAARIAALLPPRG